MAVNASAKSLYRIDRVDWSLGLNGDIENIFFVIGVAIRQQVAGEDDA